MQTKTIKSFEVKNVGVTYDGVLEPAIYGVSFLLEPKTINILIGPNGSGKSTLIKAILGILPFSGQITFFNGDGRKISKKKAHIGYVPQRLSVDTSIPITVDEFLYLNLTSCQRTKNNKKNDIETTLYDVSALDLRFKKLGNLSGGQLQRIILARALLHQPKFLILDEPETGVDVGGEQLFYELLRKLIKNKEITVLVASHSLETVHRYADQVLCINKTLVCHGSAIETLTPSTFEKLYGIDKKLFYHGHNH